MLGWMLLLISMTIAAQTPSDGAGGDHAAATGSATGVTATGLTATETTATETNQSNGLSSSTRIVAAPKGAARLEPSGGSTSRITSTIAVPATPSNPAAPAKPGTPSNPAKTASGSVYQAEPQVPTGKFTTATEIKPIMSATKSSWVAVREYDGQDLVYVTHIMAWRCGLAGMKFSVNGAQPVDWPLPPCHMDTAAPNALTADDGLPYKRFPLGSVSFVTIELIYDDLTREHVQFERKQVLMP